MYSTLTLEKEREIVKEEIALRNEKEAVYCYAVQGCNMYIHIHTSHGHGCSAVADDVGTDL